MNREVLAIDIDEVLYPFVEAFASHHNDRYGTNVEFNDFNTYSFEGPLGLTVSETVKRVYDYHAIEDLHIEPIDEAVDAMQRLSDVFDLEIITARHPQFEDATRRWLDDKFAKLFRNVNLIGYAPVMEKPVTKAEICQKIGARALIDDSLGHVSGCAEVGIEGILFGNYPWNRTVELPQGVVRLEGWKQVAEHFNV